MTTKIKQIVIAFDDDNAAFDNYQEEIEYVIGQIRNYTDNLIRNQRTNHLNIKDSNGNIIGTFVVKGD